MCSGAGFSLRERSGTAPHLWAFSVFSYESGSAIALLLDNLVATKHYKRCPKFNQRKSRVKHHPDFDLIKMWDRMEENGKFYRRRL